MGRKIVLHLHTDVRDKKPSPSNIMDGELAINCAASGETLYIKNSKEEIAEFKDDKYYQKQLSGLATKNELAQKQDIISDIDTIRNNANNYKGTVTGVKINGTTKNPSNGVVDIGTVITSHQDISGKQDKLVSGTNIKTINGESILGSGDITIISGNVMAVDTGDIINDATIEYTTKSYVDGLVGDINNVLESIINS